MDRTMSKKRLLIRKNDKIAVFWMLVMLLLFCTYKLYLYRTESTQTMTGQPAQPVQSLFGAFVSLAEE